MEHFNELSKRIFFNAKKKGFYDKPIEVGTKLMLCVSELSGALEAHRKNRYANMCGLEHFEKYVDGENPQTIDSGVWNIAFQDNIKDTFEDEIADTIMRLLDLCGYLKIDIEKHIRWKIRYNESRPYKHGKQY
jgi:NTP pyrophosphatase (non-canonical NTP hydrolase)